MKELNITIEDMAQQASKEIDKLVQEAFEKKFGLRIFCVEDKDQLERIVTQGGDIESFRYRGETFLQIKRGIKVDYNPKRTGVAYLRYVIKYLMDKKEDAKWKKK